jgi:hypothetical protein
MLSGTARNRNVSMPLKREKKRKSKGSSQKENGKPSRSERKPTRDWQLRRNKNASSNRKKCLTSLDCSKKRSKGSKMPWLNLNSILLTRLFPIKRRVLIRHNKRKQKLKLKLKLRRSLRKH